MVKGKRGARTVMAWRQSRSLQRMGGRSPAETGGTAPSSGAATAATPGTTARSGRAKTSAAVMSRHASSAGPRTTATGCAASCPFHSAVVLSAQISCLPAC